MDNVSEDEAMAKVGASPTSEGDVAEPNEQCEDTGATSQAEIEPATKGAAEAVAAGTLDACLERLKAVIARTDEAIFAGRKALWERLGSIYATSRLVADKSWEFDLQRQVRAITPSGVRWAAEEKTIRDNLLVFAMGFDHPASKRSLYKRVFEIADGVGASENLTDPDNFVRWVERNRGLVALCERTPRPDNRSKPQTIISDFTDKRRRADEKALADIQGEIDEETLTLLLVERAGDELRVVKTSAEATAVAAFIRATDDELGDVQKAKQRRDQLYRINRAVLKSAGKADGDNIVWRGAVDEAEASAVQQSLMALWNDEAWRDNYFDDEPSIKFGEKALAVLRETEHCFDPARYVIGAKPGALVPYGELTNEVKDKASLEALPGFKSWKAKPPRTSKAKA